MNFTIDCCRWLHHSPRSLMSHLECPPQHLPAPSPSALMTADPYLPLAPLPSVLPASSGSFPTSPPSLEGTVPGPHSTCLAPSTPLQTPAVPFSPTHLAPLAPSPLPRGPLHLERPPQHLVVHHISDAVRVGVALPDDGWGDDGELNDLCIEQQTLVYYSPTGWVDLSPGGEGGQGIRVRSEGGREGGTAGDHRSEGVGQRGGRDSKGSQVRGGGSVHQGAASTVCTALSIPDGVHTL